MQRENAGPIARESARESAGEPAGEAASGSAGESVLARNLRWLLLGGALLHLGLVAWVVLQRIAYPYELEWIEGSSADTVDRVLHGKAIYVAPSMEYTPYLYTPLFYWASAALAKVIGMGMLPLRLVSFLASVGTGWLVFAFVRRETKSTYFAVIAAGMLAASFKVMVFWFDIARVDCLFVFFATAAVYALRSARTVPGLAFAGVLLFLSFLSKQSALFLAAPLSLYAFFAHRGWARVAFPAAFFALSAAATALLSWQTDGWFYYYVFDMPRGHMWLREHYLGFWTRDLLRFIPLAVALSALWAGFKLVENRRRERTFYPLVLVALAGGAWLSRVHSGSGHNVVMPACVLFALFSGLALHKLLSGRLIPPWARLLVQCLAIAQFALPLYDPRRQVPTAADRAAGDRFVELLRGVEGDVFLSHPAFIATYAGKASHSDGGAMNDIFRARNRALARQVEQQIRDTIRAKRYGAIVTATWLGPPVFFDSPEFVAEVEQYYDDRGAIFTDPEVFIPVVGWKARPERLYVRKP